MRHAGQEVALNMQVAAGSPLRQVQSVSYGAQLPPGCEGASTRQAGTWPRAAQPRGPPFCRTPPRSARCIWQPPSARRSTRPRRGARASLVL
jgi:hypothetical protein